MNNPSVAKCPKNVAIPVIFIPGIMGSRLRNGDEEVVWQPGIEDWDQFWNTLDLSFSGAAEKRALLIGEEKQYFSPTYLEVDHQPDGGIADRGWGGLLTTYLPFLNRLSGQRNQLLRIDSCNVMIRYHIWAYPYNWTDSNLEAAKGLDKVVNRAVAETKEREEPLGRNVLKPILLTHSMGGLVARGYTQVLGKADTVHGVIHGAMPTHGSPELYKRMRGGFEGMSSFALGANQEQVTATAGNCPGPLELAPNRVHQGADGRRDWLRIRDGNGVAQTLPISDPYSEIYENQTDWWRLIDKTLLNPEGDQEGSNAFAEFKDMLKDVKSFHTVLERDPFHPNTRMFYGTGRQTRDYVQWRTIERVGSLPTNATASMSNGRVVLRGFNGSSDTRTSPAYGRTLEMTGATAPGDGTVHAGSGRYVNEMAVPVDDGFDHQSAFDSREARNLTLEWLNQMVGEMVSA